MFQATDLLLTKPFNDLSAVVGSVGNVATEYPVPNPDHLESNVVFQTVEYPKVDTKITLFGGSTKILMFGGSIIHVVDSTTTRIYNVKINLILAQLLNVYQLYNESSVELIVTQTSGPPAQITVLRSFSTYEGNLAGYDSFSYSAMLGFTSGDSIIRANIVKKTNEDIVDEDTANVEFYLAIPQNGLFLESSYAVLRNSKRLTEVTKLVGVLYILEHYNIVLNFTREFGSSTDLQTKSVTCNISIRDLNNLELSVGISIEKFGADPDKFYIIKFIGNTPRKIFITGSFIIPSNRNWNSKPRDLTFNYHLLS